MKLVIIDVETTGLNVRYDFIYEVGIAFINDKSITVKRYLIARELRLKDKIIMNKLRNWPMDIDFTPGKSEKEIIYEMNADVKEFFGDKKHIYSAYNKSFEEKFLSEWGFPKFDICLMKDVAMPLMVRGNALPYNEKYDSYKWPKIEEALSFYGIEFDDLHTADQDVMKEAELYLKVQEMIVNE